MAADVGLKISARRVLIVWAVYGFVSSLQQDLSASLNGHPIALWVGFALQLPQACIFAAYTPLILFLGRRFPLRGRGWRWRLALHVGFSAIVVFTDYLAFETYLPWFWPSDVPLITRTLRLYGLWAMADSLLYWVVLAIGHVQQEVERVAERARRENALKEQLSRARLDALTVRLQPHFLFNTLHAISSLVVERPRDANRMITRLSDLLRLTLHRTRTPFVPLQQELDLLEHYVALQELRFGDHLAITLTVAPDLPSATVPALLLQPIVENAVRIAIGTGNRDARVDVVVGLSGDRLRLAVLDNGPGFPRDGERLAEGEGLRNTRERLREAYGDRHTFTLADRAGGGASVVIEVPVEPASSGVAYDDARDAASAGLTPVSPDWAGEGA